MPIQLEIPNLDAQNRMFMTWAPIRVRVRQMDVPDTAQAMDLVFRNGGSGGRFWFASERGDSGNPEIALRIPPDGTPADFWMAGEFQQPSERYGDATLAVFSGATLLGEIPGMVRVRKNANTLTDDERDRFVAAFGVLNGQGSGRFAEFRAMHTAAADPEAHGNSGFPPWHRAFILDLERELQTIDPEVTLPYWRFDQPAPNLFTPDFIGLPDNNQVVRFSAGHPLEAWTTDGQPGIRRSMGFDPDEAPPPLQGQFPLNNEAATLELGGPDNLYGSFRQQFEVNPHGFAHVSFTGASFLRSISTAARDPLFFMLHANVDRLWAKWQWFHQRHDRNDPNAYAAGGRVGHDLDDSMWPWNGVTSVPRPSTAPGGKLQDSDVSSLPGGSPRVSDMLDYLNVTGRQDQPSGGELAFCYDDVPFESQPAGAFA